MTMSFPLLLTALTLRVFFLVLFTGAYIWLSAAFLTGINRVPPPQRVKVTRAVTSRMLIVTWIFLLFAIIGGALTAYVTEPGLIAEATDISALTAVLSTPHGVILALEVVVTLLMVVVNAVMQFVYLPRMSVPIEELESPNKGLKWLSSRNTSRALRAIRMISYLSLTNIVIGLIAIALGVLYSHV
ncbi:hypothetical protein [Conexivisphaera calida]|uniref:Copper resistance protein D domain-containing protein n=1 Tax=Conexivisphaera calida TaxID=1874277 RepID=A0A4P2VCV5_9ARCH|nr:hypothetical protein [Conexivisphaera calida]BBE42364.1 hypothetical protein NAS2_0975 [Conexivisphaera calida]